MNYVIHKAEDRGHANHGWLNANHSFSFASYHDPEKTHFGMLRVLNDDTVAGGMGFGKHPHDNMEIITIMRKGALQHEDSMGHKEVIYAGEVQVMSAGSGILHSEINAKKDEEVQLFQIWVFPNKKNVEPRYDKIKLDETKLKNKFFQIISPNQGEEGSWIYQDAWFNIGKFDKGTSVDYSLKKKNNGVYAFVINGEASVNGHELKKRDALGIWNIEKLNITSQSPDTEILIMDVPMI
ncbi:MAG TPA: pirin family protein [Bacteroidia bacterium]|jgi:redox-sensitive bicupin YhaK (pirin superfamily)|nr:pirin family protein [Bacteroidia bacterium]